MQCMTGCRRKDLARGFLTVQRLSANVEGKAQKYTRIGPLTIVGMNGRERTMENIKQACIEKFEVDKKKHDCDILAGERGPSFTAVSQITNWKVLHVRFCERTLGNCDDDTSELLGQGGSKSSGKDTPSDSLTLSRIRSTSFLKDLDILKPLKKKLPPAAVRPPSVTQGLAKSVPLSEMIKIGKLIPPSREIVCLMLESFDVETQTWCDPVESKISLSKEKFASGGCRDAFHATGLSGVAGKLVLKRYPGDKIFKSSQHLYANILSYPN
eukprot:Seg5477.1 transcript_id=Seg5477.1/GoldUCD/mRNA.D3Y31 product="hypothetical protein" protein_id=Seg5477.1/GoldUCD/D3Y31